MINTFFLEGGGIFVRGSKPLVTGLWRSPDRLEEFIVAFNHNVINLYFTENKSTMYASYHDKV